MSRPWLPGAVALATVIALSRAPRAQAAPVIERVVALVDGKPILSSELRHRAAPEERALMARDLPAWRLAPLRRQLLCDVLRRLVDERLVAEEARARGITVTEAEIDQAIEGVAAQQRWSRPELEAAVMAHGWTLAEYRRELASQLLEARLLALEASRSGERTQDWNRERERWLAGLRKRAFIEIRLSPR